MQGVRVVCLVLLLSFSLQGLAERNSEFARKLVQAALERTHHQVIYDGSYQRLAYPMGDVAPDRGVCTDVVIRSYRSLDIDLQQRVHEDMKSHFEDYPSLWGLKQADSNIDHRRVPNLQHFFNRHGEVLEISEQTNVYLPGDLVTWVVAGNLPHIGIVTDIMAGSGNPMIVHNIGSGPRLEDMLFEYPITGHYRYQIE